MGEASELATMMQAFNAMREEMKEMRQDLGDRLTRVEQRPTAQATQTAERFPNRNQQYQAPNNRRTGVHFNDDPETSTRNQQNEEDTGQQHGPYPRARVQQDDYGEEAEEEEDYLPPHRAPRRPIRNQGYEEDDYAPQQRGHRQQHHNQGTDLLKMTPPQYAGKVDPEAYLDWEKRMNHIFAYYNHPVQAEQHIKKKSTRGRSQSNWNSNNNNNYNKPVDKGKGIEGDTRSKSQSVDTSKDTRTDPTKTTTPQRARDITCFKYELV
ncbi:uncharacterized protein LOC130504833 [Raphanus sativus]|uniref:Uncharacterized protein LOC130504833 n=1 Tax=Raphanus sativus TaxID=3726 RepID=A0A9W3CV78_RAPSA|nr:uncharacterized protein LOC130504833 [Raphanus sativus]